MNNLHFMGFKVDDPDPISFVNDDVFITVVLLNFR